MRKHNLLVGSFLYSTLWVLPTLSFSPASTTLGRSTNLFGFTRRKPRHQEDLLDLYDDDDDWEDSLPRRTSRRRQSKQPRNNQYQRRNDSYQRINNDGSETSFQDFTNITTVHSSAKSDAHFFSKKSLEDQSLNTENQDLFLPLCAGAGITRPSRIQNLAWPQVKTGQHVIVADQTGSGKTLAYLIPLLQKALSTPPQKDPGIPKILVLAPTAELADQIRDVCHKISRRVPFSTMVVTATGKHRTLVRDQIRFIQRQPIDVLISTPGRISTILRTRKSGLNLSQLQAIVLDEVDILLIDDTFGEQLRTIALAAAPVEQTQFVFVTATLPDQIVRTVEAEFPGVTQIRGPGLHRMAPSLTEHLVDVTVPPLDRRSADKCLAFKMDRMLQALEQNPSRRTLVFCNTVESCRSVENSLKRRDRGGRSFIVGAYHNALTPQARNANLELFVKARNRKGQDITGSVGMILVCTDRAARGVDFGEAPVDHVVVFDFPKDPAEYVRRVGRTARAGRSGTATVLAYGWQLPIARKVMTGDTANSRDDIEMHSHKLGERDDDDQLFAARKSRKRKRMKDTAVKVNIERGRLWTEDESVSDSGM